jgi:zinc protease
MNRAAVPNAQNVTRTVLDNGLVILVRENFSAPVVAIDGGIPCGSLHERNAESDVNEPPALAGLAGFTASMLTRGSRRYSQDAFDAAVEDVGASLGTGADPHLTMFGANSLAEDFPTMLDVLADILQRPTFPAEQVARLRNRRQVFLQERDHDAAHWTAMRFAAGLYGAAHPYGYPVAGFSESVERINCADLVAFHRDFYTPNGAIVVVAGAIAAADAVAQIADAFGDWQGAPNPHDLPPMPVPVPSHEQRVYPQGKVQCDLILGAPAPPRNHPDHFAVRVANMILGQFGLMGRLGERLREEMGIAYYVGSQYDAARTEGAWWASIGVNPEHAPLAVQTIVEEFHRLGTELADAEELDEELDDVQAYMTGILPVALETNSGVASTLFNMEWQQLGMDYLLAYPELIYSVSAQDVRRVTQTYLCEQPLRLAVAGPEIPAPLPLDLLQATATTG